MTAVDAASDSARADNRLRQAFLKWQCRVRQMAMRDNFGRPDDAITPALFLNHNEEPLGHIITVMNKASGYSLTPELNHILSKTNDPAQRRDQAIRFLSATYFQRASEFSDVLTATFPPSSPGAAMIRAASTVRLVFDAYAQRFELICKTRHPEPQDPLHQATIVHNKLFNPTLDPGTEVLAFEPDWPNCSSEPELH